MWNPDPAFTTVGVRVDDVMASASSFGASGFVVEIAAADSGWAYLRSEDGLRIELVDRPSLASFDRWCAGGTL